MGKSKEDYSIKSPASADKVCSHDYTEIFEQIHRLVDIYRTKASDFPQAYLTIERKSGLPLRSKRYEKATVPSFAPIASFNHILIS